MSTTSAPSPWGPILRVLVYGVFLYALADVTLLRIPAEDGWALFGEYQRLEMVQVALLVLGMVLALAAALRHPSSRPVSILIVGMLAAVLVREHNNYFKDNYFSGLWELIVLAVLAITLALAWPTRRNLVPAVADLVRRPAFGWLSASLVLLAFAQSLDERAIWVLLLGEDVPYAAQRMAEESVEAAAYALCAVGTFEYLWGFRTGGEISV